MRFIKGVEPAMGRTARLWARVASFQALQRACLPGELRLAPTPPRPHPPPQPEDRPRWPPQGVGHKGAFGI